MKACLVFVLCWSAGLVTSRAPSKCHSCAIDSDHGHCGDSYYPPPKMDIEPGMCDKISELPTEQTKLCKKYTKHPGYYVACANRGMSFSCKASCGVKVDDVGKNFTINNKLKDIMGTGLLKGLGHSSNEDLLHGVGAFGDNSLNFANNQGSAPHGQGQVSHRQGSSLGGQGSASHGHGGASNPHNNNNYNNPGFFNSFNQNYQPEGALDVYKPLTLPKQNQFNNFNFKPLPPPQKAIHNSFAHQPANYPDPRAAPSQPAGYPNIPVQPNNPQGYPNPHSVPNQPTGYPNPNAAPNNPSPNPSQPYGTFFPKNPKVGYQPKNNNPTPHPTPSGQSSDLYKAVNALPHPANLAKPAGYRNPNGNTAQADSHVIRPSHYRPSSGAVPHAPSPKPYPKVQVDPHANPGNPTHTPTAPNANYGKPAPHVDNSVPHSGYGEVASVNKPAAHADSSVPHLTPNVLPTGAAPAPYAPVPTQAPYVPVPTPGPKKQYPPVNHLPHKDPAIHPTQPHVSNAGPPQGFTEFKNFAPFPSHPAPKQVHNTVSTYSRNTAPELPDLQLPSDPNYRAYGSHPQARRPHENLAAKAIDTPFRPFGFHDFSNSGNFGTSQYDNLNSNLGKQMHDVNQAAQHNGANKGLNSKVSSISSSNSGGYSQSSSRSGSTSGGNQVHFNKGQNRNENLLSGLGTNKDSESSEAVKMVKGDARHSDVQHDAMDDFLHGFHANPVSHKLFNQLGNHAGYFQGFNNIVPDTTGKVNSPGKTFLNNRFFDFMHQG